MRDMKKRIKAYLVLGFVALWGVMLASNNIHWTDNPTGNGMLLAQANLKPPNFTWQSAAGLSIKGTAGTVNNGGHAVVVAASSTGITASKNDCSSPNYANCNFLFANPAGTVANTTTQSTAFAAGNTLLAFIETSASAVTKLAFPQQSSLVAAGGLNALMDCGTSSACATPTQVQGMAIKAAMGTATVSGGTVTVTGLSFGSGATFGCAVSVSGATSTLDVASYTIVSGSSITIREQAGSGGGNPADTVHYTCIGY